MTTDNVVEEWNELIRAKMISNNSCSVCGLAHIKDGAVFAAACSQGDPVDSVYKPNYDVSGIFISATKIQNRQKIWKIWFYCKWWLLRKISAGVYFGLVAF